MNEKSKFLWRIKAYALRKKFSFRYFILSKAHLWKKAISQKDPIWYKITFLHKNEISIELQFWDFTEKISYSELYINS